MSKRDINEIQESSGCIEHYSQKFELSMPVNSQINITKLNALRLILDSSKESYQKYGGLFPSIFSPRNSTESYNVTDEYYILDSYITSMSFDDGFLKNFSKNNEELFIPIIRNIRDMQKQIKSNNDLSESEKNIILKFIESYEDSITGNFLEQNIDLNLNILDHHGSYYEKSEIATTLVFKYIEQFLEEGQSKNPDFTKQKLLKYLLKKGSILHTKGTIDTDAVLSHFALLNPIFALKYKKILSQAALKGDLNISVEDEKAVSLNHLITGLVFINQTIKKDFEKQLNDIYKEITKEIKNIYKTLDFTNLKNIINSKIYKKDKLLNLIKSYETILFVENNKNFTKNILDKFSNELKEILDFDFVNSIQEFDTIIGNAIINMVPEMLNYLENQTLTEGRYDLLFKYSKNYFTKLVDDGVKKIKSGLDSNLNVTNFVEGNTITFVSEIPISFNGIPIESFFNYSRANIESSPDFKYLAVFVPQNGKGKKSKNLGSESDSNVKKLEFKKFQKKFASISAYAGNILDLSKIDILGKLSKLQELESQNYRLAIEEKTDEFVKLVCDTLKIDYEKLDDGQKYNIGNILTILASDRKFFGFDNELLESEILKSLDIINEIKNSQNKETSFLDIESIENLDEFEKILAKVCKIIINDDNFKIKGNNVSEIKSKLLKIISDVKSLNKRKLEGERKGFFTYRTGLILGDTISEIEDILKILNDSEKEE